MDDAAVREIRVLRSVLEQARERIVITDREGTILYVNPAFERITGYTKADALGHTPRILKSGKHSHAFYENFWNVLLKGGVIRAGFVNRKKTGELYCEEQLVSSVTDEHGKILYFLSTATDITESIKQAQMLKGVQQGQDLLEEVAFGHRDRVVELKQEINTLLRELGRPPKYLI